MTVINRDTKGLDESFMCASCVARGMYEPGDKVYVRIGKDDSSGKEAGIHEGSVINSERATSDGWYDVAVQHPSVDDDEGGATLQLVVEAEQLVDPADVDEAEILSKS